MDYIKLIQNRFLHLVRLRAGYNHQDAPINNLAAQLSLQSLRFRRIFHDILFLYRTLNGLVVFLEILASINLQVITGTRSWDLFGCVHHTSSYRMNTSISQRLGSNLLSSDVGYFCDSLSPPKWLLWPSSVSSAHHELAVITNMAVMGLLLLPVLCSELFVMSVVFWSILLSMLCIYFYLILPCYKNFKYYYCC